MKYLKIRYTLPLLALAWISLFLFGQEGLLALIRLKRECVRLEYQIDAEKRRIDSLKDVRMRLEKDPQYIERQVRGQLGYVYPGERVIKFVSEE